MPLDGLGCTRTTVVTEVFVAEIKVIERERALEEARERGIASNRELIKAR